MTRHLVLIDAMSLLFRAYHAVRPLNRARDGLPVNALFGFTQMLMKVVTDLKPDYCVVVSDSAPPNWRHGLYDKYKANRPPPDADMLAQLPMLEPLVAAFGLPLVRQAGLEADDLIASAVRWAATHVDADIAQVTIMTSDKDLLQLVQDAPVKVRLFDSMKDRFLGVTEAVEKFGVTPDKVLQVQALMGDSSDNIPGIAGVGPKTAAELVQQFGDLETLFARLEEVKRDTLREKLVAGREAAFLSRQLASLKADVPLDVTQWRAHVDLAQAAEYLRDELEFTTLAKRLEQKPAAPKVKETSAAALTAAVPESGGWGPYRAIVTQADWVAFHAKIKAAGVVALDTETTSLNPRAARLVGVSLAVPQAEGMEAVYVPILPVQEGTTQTDLFTEGSVGPHGVEGLDLRADLTALLADAGIKKVAHNLKYDWHIVQAYTGSTALVNYEDTLLLAQTVVPNMGGAGGGYGLDNLFKTQLGHVMIPFESVAGKGKAQITFDKVPLDAATAYAAEDAEATLRLWQHLGEAYPDAKVYDSIEHPLLPVLAAMEAAGVRINVAHLQSLSTSMAEQLARMEQELHSLAGHPFNVQSTQQLAVVFFDELGAGSDKQRKSRSTAVDVLEALADTDGKAAEMARLMLGYRQTQKLRSTYTEALLAQIDPRTGRVHTHYQQMGAATGRFSSSDPNVQNIPIRTAEGREVRKAFIPQQGWSMVSADYSQIELRLLAHLSGSKALTKAFVEGLDIHAYTASLVANIPLQDVSKEQRRAAKFINFGLVYGMGARSLAGQIGCSMSEAQAWIDAYFARYDGVRDYMEANKRLVKARGYVETLYGRRVWLPDIHAPHAGLRAGAERAAINAPLQGSNADIIKLAMVAIAKVLPEGARMLLQVHDELVFEASDEGVAWLRDNLPALMGGVAKLNVPLAVGVGVGPNWDAAH